MQDRIDLYAVLSLTRACNTSDVKQAFKKLALQAHPDKGKGLDAEFIAIALAYHVLSDPKLRAAYDANEREFAKTRQTLVDSFDLDKSLQIFASFFGTANPFAASSSGVNDLFDSAEAERQPKPAPNLNLTLVNIQKKE
jgi:DnaJ-class molecular chaperone